MFNWNKYIAGFLIIVLSTAIVPLESFHHHEEASKICMESNAHIEQKEFQCELLDFVLPVYELPQKHINSFYISYSEEIDAAYRFAFCEKLYSLPENRGPPYSNTIA